MTEPAEDVDAIASALRADAADLEVYANVLTTSLADALPAEMVVVDRSHQARTLVGYTDRAEIGQAVDDALVGR